MKVNISLKEILRGIPKEWDGQPLARRLWADVFAQSDSIKTQKGLFDEAL
ncbi:TPA: hypothetical protein SE504_001873 [Campylobacter jejuni]|nr:hypothetical protein [Campylobacter jejuni]HEG6281611.1 hypothetical protein [Campylobacter jejuni]